VSENGIAEPVRRFLSAHISSIEQLEVLVLLRTTASREWSAAEVSRELGSSVMSIQDRLGDLAARGILVVREAGPQLVYRYAPASDETRAIIDGLAQAYRERRLTVVNLIYSRPASDARVFSEAFFIGKRKGEE
jgi:predicted ArsR family transcriptional regulator